MENNTNTQTEGNNTQQTAGDSTEPKTFTQEEVNRIVQDRLARERRGTGQTIEERELDLTRRENRMKCAEKLTEAGYPKELLDILDTSNAETFSDADPGAERSTDPAGGGRYSGRSQRWRGGGYSKGFRLRLKGVNECRLI